MFRHRQAWGIFCALLLTCALAVPAIARGSRVDSVRAGGMPSPSNQKGAFGKISAVSAASITVKRPDMTTATFTIASTTKIMLNGQESTTAKLMTGQFAVVLSADGKAATGVDAHSGPPSGPPMIGKGAIGRISAVSDASITVKEQNGTTATFTISSSTKITLDFQTSTAAKLMTGQLAAVSSADGKAATSIDAHTMPPPPPPGKGASGQISAVSDASITVKRRDGSTATFAITSATKVKVNGEDAEVSDLAEGQFAAVASADGKVATFVDADATSIPVNPGAPSGTVTGVGSATFTVKEASGTVITVDVVSGTTYQLTTRSTAGAATVGGYVAAMGSLANGQLDAVDLAFVPVPPSFIPSSEVQTTAQGTIYFGQITSVQDGIITISTSEGSKTINAAPATEVTLTATSSLQALTVGETVEVNGPQDSATVYTGHQINIGLTPAVVGQFD